MKAGKKWLLAVLTAMSFSGAAYGVSTNTYWVGEGDTSNWYDTANWTNGWVPDNYTWIANFSNNVAITFTNTGTVTLNQIISRGSAKITLGFTTVNLVAGTGYNPSSKLYVGPGGADFGNGTISFGNGGNVLQLHGDADLWALRNNHDNTMDIIQGAGAGYFRIKNFNLNGTAGGLKPIKAWRFGTNTLTISSFVHTTGIIQFQGQPTFETAATRPDWSLYSGINEPGGPAILDLNGYTLQGNILSIANGSAAYRHNCVTNGVAGGTVDVNTLIIGNGQAMSYVSLSNTAVILRGAGTVYDNRSTNQTYFVMTNNCTVTLNPTGGVCNLDSGSKDRNSVARDPADWANNFAFDKIRIGEGDTVTLTGTANIEGGGNSNAVYATSLIGEGAGATVVLNGHNIYLLKNAENITFDATAGGKVFQKSTQGSIVVIR
jgi:hypothetical protein